MIDNYQFGKITINGQTYDHDIYIDLLGKIKPWQQKESHLIDENEIKEVLIEKPEILIIGTGAYGIAKVSEEAKNLIQKNGIKLIILPTPEAIKKYNQLKENKKLVATYLHLTC